MVTPAAIAAAFGGALSLAFAFVPGLKEKFRAVPSDRKPLVVLGCCAAIGAGLVALACVGAPLGEGATCPAFTVEALPALLVQFATNVIAAAGSAQTAFALVVGPIKEAAKQG